MKDDKYCFGTTILGSGNYYKCNCPGGDIVINVCTNETSVHLTTTKFLSASHPKLHTAMRATWRCIDAAMSLVSLKFRMRALA